MKKIISSIILMNIFIQLLYFNISYADERSELKEKINQTNTQIDQEKENLEKIKQEKSQVEVQVENLSLQIEKCEDEIEILDSQISELKTKINDAQIEIKQKEDEFDKAQELLEKRLVGSYQRGNLSYLDIIFSSKSFNEIIDNYYMVNQIIDADNDLMDEINTKKEEIEEKKQSLEDNKNKLDKTKSEKEQKSKQLSSTKNEKNKYIAQLSSEQKKSQEKIDQLVADNKVINSQLQAAERAYAQKIAELEAKKKQQNNANKNSGSSNGSTNSSSNQTSGNGFMIHPVNGPVTATMYYSSGAYHGAIDYGVPVGTPVKVAADGVVLSVQHLESSYGNFVVIQHANGIRSWYAHGNGVFYVSPGQVVSKGQVIMQSGNSGNSSRPHLHFEVRVAPYNYSYGGGDSRRNPYNYF